jgi:AcrR family transcriptional regulator
MAHRIGLDTAAVIEAAIKLVDEEGLEQLSLARLAERLGIRTPSLYNHVAGMPGLRQALAIYCLRDFQDRLMRAAVGKSGAEAVRAFATTYLLYGRETPGRYGLTLQAPTANDQALQSLAKQVIEVILAILAPFQLEEEESVHAIRGLRSIIHGFLTLEMAGGFGLPVDLDNSFQWLLSIFIAGLTQRAPIDNP